MTDTTEEFLSALRAVIEPLGASVVRPRSSRPGDQPVVWRGETVAYLRLTDLHGVLERFTAAIEREFGTKLANMTRTQKQAAVRRLDEQGAFLLRGAVEDVAGWMGVSKVTLYSYLNAIERSRADGP
ncbi:MAG: transcriptional regulator [Actinomycetia bacterium]|nr:transcriptional regulator [Actinomycetes bacterium]MCP4224086.1 transcriptional regulator [Actinomycetes bacterium]MCP5033109.1 transcriptional regulator [Actinomycetes bacterium]